MGGYLEFRVKSIGSLFGEDSVCKVVPHLLIVTEEGYKPADVYYEEETDQGKSLQRWNPEGKSFWLNLSADSGTAIKQWQGSFSLPERLYIAESGTDVFEYQRHYGLNFSESFWLKDATLVLCFALSIQNTQGEILDYGKIPEGVANNIWQREAGVSERYDKKGNRYKIDGGEVAIIYPGDTAEKGYTTNGIY